MTVLEIEMAISLCPFCRLGSRDSERLGYLPKATQKVND